MCYGIWKLFVIELPGDFCGLFIQSSDSKIRYWVGKDWTSPNYVGVW